MRISRSKGRLNCLHGHRDKVTCLCEVCWGVGWLLCSPGLHEPGWALGTGDVMELSALFGNVHQALALHLINIFAVAGSSCAG